ncbi:glycoside hydrolase superfamily [Mycena galopus ATCC 62051]|nr:glycoside hydrolase superfamily [Mycena galopus ATCC 62051]
MGMDMLEPCLGEIPRIAWKGLCLPDSPLGATWDLGCIRLRGEAMGREHRGKGVNVALVLMTNLARALGGGRNWDGFGADPFLSGAANSATIKGYQIVSVIATLYAWPFAEVVNADVGGVMCAYNKINQTPACQNTRLINGILKEELGFQGASHPITIFLLVLFICSFKPALAGLDMNMPGFVGYGFGPQVAPDTSKATHSYWGAALVEMVRKGRVPMARLDDMVIRTLGVWYKMAQDRDYPAVNLRQVKCTSYLRLTPSSMSFAFLLTPWISRAQDLLASSLFKYTVCANTVVVMHVVGAVAMESWIEHPNVTAGLHAGLPGQKSGNSLVDVMFADGPQATNPSGRLPYTIAKTREDYPADIVYKSGMQTPQITYEESLSIDYSSVQFFLVVFKPPRVVALQMVRPRFEFGFGLSYTKFAYSGLTILASDKDTTESASANARASAFMTVSTRAASEPPTGSSPPQGNIGEPASLHPEILTVSFRMQNMGMVTGNEVPQLYVAFPTVYSEPPKVLRGFARMPLERGETKPVTIGLRRKDVSV